MTYPTDTKPSAAPVNEIGYQVANPYMWWLLENETTQELQWPQSVYVFDQMRRTDSQVTSVLRAVTLPVLRTPWRIDPNGARDEVVELVSDDLGLPIMGKPPKAPPRTRDKFSWTQHLSEALLMLPLGYSYFEQVYRVDPDGARAHLRKLALRPAKSIQKINVATDGGLISIEQYWAPSDGEPKPIPVDRLVAYIHAKEGGNWLGTSILRPVYKNWLLKDRLLRVQAQTIERNGMGIPLYRGEEGAPDLSAGLAMAKAWRAGEAAGTAIPFGADLVLRGVEGTLPDALPVVEYHDGQIARAVLAHFLNLGGQAGTGSWALGSTFADFFTLSLQTLAQQVADTATCYVVEDLVDVNWGPEEPAPRICFDEIGARQQATAEAMRSLVDAGILRPDEGLEGQTRQRYGLPPAEPDTARQAANPIQDSTATPGDASTASDTGQYSVAASAGPDDDDPDGGVVPDPDPEPDGPDDGTPAVAEEPLTGLQLRRALRAMGQSTAQIREHLGLKPLPEPIAAKYNPNQLRNPEGSVGGGRFRSKSAQIIQLVQHWLDGGGKGASPLGTATPAQLRATGKGLGVNPPTGMSRNALESLVERTAREHHGAGRKLAEVNAPAAPSAKRAEPKVPAARKLTAADRAKVDRIASAFHEDWRKTRLQPDGSFEPRVKKTKDQAWIKAHGADEVDIANSTYDQLPEDWKAENKAAAEVVHGILAKHGGKVDLSDEKTRLQVGEEIHQAWLSRNEYAKGGELDVPFAELSKVEQDKDTDQLKVAMGALTPAKPAGEPSPVRKNWVDTGEPLPAAKREGLVARQSRYGRYAVYDSKGDKVESDFTSMRAADKRAKELTGGATLHKFVEPEATPRQKAAAEKLAKAQNALNKAAHAGQGKVEPPRPAAPPAPSAPSPAPTKKAAPSPKVDPQATLDAAPVNRADEAGTKKLLRDAGFSAEEADASTKALSRYYSSPYLNQHLKGVKLDASSGTPEQLDAEVTGLDRVMSVSKVTEPVTVHRGLDGSALFGDKKGSLEGVTWTDPGFASTSADPHLAETFAPANTSYSTHKTLPVVMSVRLPKGASAVQMSGTGDEAEMLLPHGQTYRVVADHGEVEYKGDFELPKGEKQPKYRSIDVEIVPAGGPAPSPRADAKPVAEALNTLQKTVSYDAAHKVVAGLSDQQLQDLWHHHVETADDRLAPAFLSPGHTTREQYANSIVNNMVGPARQREGVAPVVAVQRDQFWALSPAERQRVRAKVSDPKSADQWEAALPPSTARADAKAKYAAVAQSRPYASAAAAVAELTGKKQSNAVIAEHVRAIAHPDSPDMAEAGSGAAHDLEQVAAAFAAGNPTLGKRRMTAALKKQGITQGPVGTVPFDPAAHEHLGSASPEQVREVVVENKIRAAYAGLRRPDGPQWVGLADLRAELGDVPKAEVDAALIRLLRSDKPGSNRLIPEENQKTLTPSDHAAAINVSGEDKHLVSIADPTPRPLPGAPEPGTPVAVVRPGMSLHRGEGDHVQLSKAVVMSAPGKVPAKAPDFDHLQAQLDAAKTKDEGKAALQGLTPAELKDLGEHLDLSVSGTKQQRIDTIVKHTVGGRLMRDIVTGAHKPKAPAKVAKAAPSNPAGILSSLPADLTPAQQRARLRSRGVSKGEINALVPLKSAKAPRTPLGPGGADDLAEEFYRHPNYTEQQIHDRLAGLNLAELKKVATATNVPLPRGPLIKTEAGPVFHPLKKVSADELRQWIAAAIARDRKLLKNDDKAIRASAPDAEDLIRSEDEDDLDDDDTYDDEPSPMELAAMAGEKVAAAAGHDVTPGHDQLHHYWTQSAEGRARWVDSPKPWTTLLANLVEEIHDKPLETLKRFASRWYIEVFGFSAGSDKARVAHGHPPRGHVVGPG